MFGLRNFHFALCLTVLLLAGCRSENQDNSPSMADENQSPEIIAVSYPLKYLTQRLIGDSIPVVYPVPNDISGREWQPDRESIRRIQHADMIVANGIGASYAKWLETVSVTESKLCRSATRGLALSDYIGVEDMSTVHSHGPEGEHSHPLMVAFTWLDPDMALKQSVYIAGELERVYPQHAESIQQNLQSLRSDLESLSKEMIFVHTDVRWIAITSNPDLKFFTRRINLEDRHLNWLQLPTVDAIKLDKRIVNWRGENGQGTNLYFLSSIGLTPELTTFLQGQEFHPAYIDVMDRPPAEGDYLSVMKENIRRFAYPN